MAVDSERISRRARRARSGVGLRLAIGLCVVAALFVIARSPARSGPFAGAQAPPAPPPVASAFSAPRLEIDLPDGEVEKLRAALASAAGSEARNDAPPRFAARGRGDGQQAPLRLTPLADRSERLEAGSWPLAVRVRDGGHLFGLDRFELRAPAIRGDQAEMLMLEHLRREGLLTPRVFFVKLFVDGESAGLMKVREQLAKEMIEAHERRNGAILRFADGRARESDSPGLAHAPDEFLARPLVFERNPAKRSKAQTRDRALAVALLDAFLQGRLPAREVFDVDLMARYLAIAEVWRAVDALRWPNLRFYFNPVTLRLEPIAYAASPPDLFLDDGLVATAEAWPRTLLRDPELRAAYVRETARIGREMAGGSTLAWLRESEAPLLRALRSENREHPPFAFEPIRRRAERLAALDLDATIAAALAQAPPALAAAAAADAPLPHNPIPAVLRDEVLARHPFLRWEQARRRFVSAPGEWQVAGSLVLPEGDGLALSAGTTLRFEEDAMLLATGPLEWIGTASAPIVLEGRRGDAGEEASWQGVVALRSAQPHRWEHVVVRNTTGIDRDGWRLTGGITVRAARIAIRDSRIAGSRAEDALNLIRVHFDIANLELTQTRSDGLDGDFTTGHVAGGRFARIGGDAIDVSGSEVTIDGTHISDVGDKAISVGERSRLVARHVEIERAGTAVASKDGSIALLEDSLLRDIAHAALMAYTKKSEYGRARLEARGVEMHEVGRVAMAQHGSDVVVDGATQAPGALDVEGLYRQGYMKK